MCPILELIQTLKKCLFCHVYCAQLWAHLGAIAIASCAVSNRESRYARQELLLIYNSHILSPVIDLQHNYPDLKCAGKTIWLLNCQTLSTVVESYNSHPPELQRLLISCVPAKKIWLPNSQTLSTVVDLQQSHPPELKQLLIYSSSSFSSAVYCNRRQQIYSIRNQ